VKVKFYLKASGKNPVEAFLEECSAELKSDFFDAVNLLTSGVSLAMPLSRNLASIHQGLQELRLKDRSGQVRVFYFLKKAMRSICSMLSKRRLKSYLKMRPN
jgi:hypothetical protein